MFNCSRAYRAFLLVQVALFSAGLVGHSVFAAVQDGSSADAKQDNNNEVVVSDPAFFEAALENGAGGFSFTRTLDAILASGAGHGDSDRVSDAERERFLTSLIETFSREDTMVSQPISGLAMKVDGRPGEAGLKAGELLGMIPVGLFNRLDLADKDFQHCGEHRIVYAVPDSGNKLKRFLIIFEAKIDNPGEGLEGCALVADVWRKAARTTDNQEKAQILEEFYYGTDWAEVEGLKPVIHAHHFGVPMGQVRGNLFFDDPNLNWQLREWRVAVREDEKLVFKTAPVAGNPLAELYQDGDQGSEAGDVLERERTRFQAEFLTTYSLQLVSTDHGFKDPDPAADKDNAGSFETILVSTLGAKFDPRFNEFQSDSDNFTGGDVVASNAGSQFRSQLRPIVFMPSAAGNTIRTITPEHLLNRAGAVTCGGCHEYSNGQPIAFIGTGDPSGSDKPINWPASLGFVHISEEGELSPALINHFLEFRKKKLETVKSPAIAGAKDFRAAAGAPRGWQEIRATFGMAAARGVADSPDRRNRKAKEKLSAVDFAGLDAAIALERAREQAKDGAFVRYRTPH